MSQTLNLLVGDCRKTLRDLAAQSVRVRTCVTSPPYWGLRDYGTAKWTGGDPTCDHLPPNDAPAGNRGQPVTHPGRQSNVCRKCGAKRIDAQIGLEQSPQEYVAALVEVLRAVREVLADDGTLWLNLGDSYAGSWGAQSRGSFTPGTLSGASSKEDSLSARQIMAAPNRTLTGSVKNTPGLKPKDLVGIPWRVAFALQEDGWYLRQDIIWHKPNPMPESIADRCTKAHEYLFLLSKCRSYYFDAAAISEESVYQPPGNVSHKFTAAAEAGDSLHQTKRGLVSYAQRVRESVARGGFSGKTNDLTGRESFRSVKPRRNKRSVWTVPSEPYRGAHFAVMPPSLVRPCILAGSEPGDVVLDCFGGSGTVGAVALELGRSAVLCELNEGYAKLARARCEKSRPHWSPPIRQEPPDDMPLFSPAA